VKYPKRHTIWEGGIISLLSLTNKISEK